jgi:hypothetical protein
MRHQPEYGPLLNWLDTLDRLAPCPAELLPDDIRATMESTFGPADTYIAIAGKWLGPYGHPDQVAIFHRGSSYERMLGLTKAEVVEQFAPTI